MLLVVIVQFISDVDNFRLEASMESLRLLGTAPSETASPPVFAASLGSAVGAGESEKFLSVMFETNPMDERCDTRIDINSNSFEITYDAVRILFLSLSISGSVTVPINAGMIVLFFYV